MNELASKENVGELTGSTTSSWLASETYLQYAIRMSRELWAFRFAIMKLVSKNLSNRYRGSFLGFFWSLLNPLLSMMVLSGVFALLWRCDLKEFAPFIFSGLLPWTFISTSLEKGASSLISSEQLLKTVYAPKPMFALVHIGTEAFNFLFCVMAFYTLGVFFGHFPTFTLLLLPFLVAVTGVYCFGLALTLSVATVYFRDISHILTILLSLMFYMLPILYPVSKIPEAYQWIIYYNPFYCFISLFQSVLDAGSFPSVSALATASGLALASFAFGLFLLKVKERNLVFRL